MVLIVFVTNVIFANLFLSTCIKLIKVILMRVEIVPITVVSQSKHCKQSTYMTSFLLVSISKVHMHEGNWTCTSVDFIYWLWKMLPVFLERVIQAHLYWYPFIGWREAVSIWERWSWTFSSGSVVIGLISSSWRKEEKMAAKIFGILQKRKTKFRYWCKGKRYTINKELVVKVTYLQFTLLSSLYLFWKVFYLLPFYIVFLYHSHHWSWPKLWGCYFFVALRM